MALDLVFHRERGWLRADAWASDTFDFWAFDRHVDVLIAAGEPLTVRAAAEQIERMRTELIIRTQRVARARNAASDTDWFARVLDEHRAMHDTSKPLVLADLDHALDAWQWSLRLDPDASSTVQLAVLLHDIERLVSEADARVEHDATDYQAFKDAHARAGARLAGELLDRAGVPAEIRDGACELIATHERAGPGAAIRAVNDADALSFFSLNSPGYLTYFGAEQTQNKIAYTLARMSPAARSWLPALRLPRFVRDRVLHGQRA